ncbi:MAG: MFS transporter [Hyphomicrobiaceae bacterium]|nr:MFS transporter [Hyphomicrobiaceae bacterium]
MSLNPFRAAGDLFRIPDYRRLWVAGALSGMTRWLEFIALGIYAYELTRSPQMVALLAVIRMAPYVLLGFFIGALADRFDRCRLMMLVTSLLALVTLGMTILTATGHASYTAVAVVTFVSGVFWAVDMPVRRRLMADVAGDGNIASALGFDNATTYATRALGPLAGGATYQLLGIEGIYALITIAYLVCLEMAVGLTRKPTADNGPQKGVLASLAIPRELILNRRFAIIMGITLVHNLCSFPFLTMVPVISQKDFQLVPYLVGAMSSLEGIGGTVGAIVVGIIGNDRRLFPLYFLGPTMMLTLVLGLSFHLTVTAAIPILLLMGMAAASFTATQYALVHVSTPPEHRGKATGVLSMFIGSAMLGHYFAGHLFGTFASPVAMRIIAMCGLVALLVLGVLWVTSKDRKRQPATAAG